MLVPWRVLNSWIIILNFCSGDLWYETDGRWCLQSSKDDRLYFKVSAVNGVGSGEGVGVPQMRHRDINSSSKHRQHFLYACLWFINILNLISMDFLWNSMGLCAICTEINIFSSNFIDHHRLFCRTSNGNFSRQIRILLVSIVHRCQYNLLKLGLNKGKGGSDMWLESLHNFLMMMMMMMMMTMMRIYDDLWRFMMIYDDLWWFMTISFSRFGSLFSRKYPHLIMPSYQGTWPHRHGNQHHSGLISTDKCAVERLFTYWLAHFGVEAWGRKVMSWVDDMIFFPEVLT